MNTGKNFPHSKKLHRRVSATVRQSYRHIDEKFLPYKNYRTVARSLGRWGPLFGKDLSHIPLWKRGIKGDLKMECPFFLYKISPGPSFPKRGIKEVYSNIPMELIFLPLKTAALLRYCSTALNSKISPNPSLPKRGNKRWALPKRGKRSHSRRALSRGNHSVKQTHRIWLVHPRLSALSLWCMA